MFYSSVFLLCFKTVALTYYCYIWLPVRPCLVVTPSSTYLHKLTNTFFLLISSLLIKIYPSILRTEPLPNPSRRPLLIRQRLLLLFLFPSPWLPGPVFASLPPLLSEVFFSTHYLPTLIENKGCVVEKEFMDRLCKERSQSPLSKLAGEPVLHHPLSFEWVLLLWCLLFSVGGKQHWLYPPEFTQEGGWWQGHGSLHVLLQQCQR